MAVFLRIWRRYRFVLFSSAAGMLVFKVILNESFFEPVFITHPAGGSLFVYLFFIMFQLLDVLFLNDALYHIVCPTAEMRIRGFRPASQAKSFLICFAAMAFKAEAFMILFHSSRHMRALSSCLLIMAAFLMIQKMPVRKNDLKTVICLLIICALRMML